MKMEINNFDELLTFLERKEITSQHINELLIKSIGVYCFGQDGKEEIISQLKEYWASFGNLPITERPIFLSQKSLNFSINDIYKETVQR
jgi:hypothetical protein